MLCLCCELLSLASSARRGGNERNEQRGERTCDYRRKSDRVRADASRDRTTPRTMDVSGRTPWWKHGLSRVNHVLVALRLEGRSEAESPSDDNRRHLDGESQCAAP